jgi:hypothetical protein
MGNLIQDIVLSDFMVFVVMGIALLLVTNWAFRLREFAGYALGWLVGIFVIIFLSLITSSTAPVPVTTVPDGGVTTSVNFFAAMIASAFGLLIGYGVLELVKFGGRSQSRASRALLIATLVTINLVSWYLLLMAVQETRLVIALFVLAFSIGMLFNFIVSRRVRPAVAYPAESYPPANYPPDNYPPAAFDAQAGAYVDPNAPVSVSPYANVDNPVPTQIDVPMDIPTAIAQRLENSRNIVERRRK